MSFEGRRCAAFANELEGRSIMRGSKKLATFSLPGVIAALAFLGCGDGGGGIQLGAGAQVDITPSLLAFPEVPRDQLARLNVTVRHIGTSGTINLKPIRLETDSLDLLIGEIEADTLSPGEEVRIQIVYSSAHDEPDTGVLVIGHNLAGRPDTRINISTPGQRGRLIGIPQQLDFGIVQAAAPKTIDLRVLNSGTAPATVTGALFEGEDVGDFQALIPAAATVAPGSEIIVPIVYSPTGRNDDEVTLTLTTERPDVSMVVNATGEEETPVLAVTPSLVQLGWTRPFEVAGREIVILNEGNTDLAIESIALEDAPNVVSVTGRPPGAFTLRPNEAQTIGVVFSPVREVPMTAEPLAKIRIVSNDAARNPFVVPVYGAAGDPSILVIPESIVDFAFVAEGFTSKRSVVIVNQGAGPVTVTRAELVDPSSDEFVFVNPGVLPKVLNPGQTVQLDLTFENKRGADGSEFARFFLYTSDPVVPEYPLDVVGRRAQRPTCEAAFVPDLLALGAFRPGAIGEGKIVIQNTGSGNCEYREREFDACLADQFGISVQFICDNQLAFNPFTITGEPAPQTILGPGDRLEFDLAFNAPGVRSDYGRDSYYARLAALLYDPNSRALEFVSPPGGVGRGVNVRAESAVPRVSVDPGKLSFGVVRTDCASDVKQVRVRADGPIAATVTKVEPIGCGDEMRVTGPAVPAVIEGFSAQYWSVAFAPDTVVPRECVLRIENDSDNKPIVDIALSGQGTAVTHVIDAFRQLPAPKVDVLFVIDDSFSMGDDQERLRQELPQVIDIATTWAQDYHLGITTTDTLQVRGEFVGFPRFADTATDPSEFAHNLLVGTAGYYIEMGLEAAYLALYNRSAETPLACNPDLAGQCPRDDDGLGLICVAGSCAGRNNGFLRPDAELVIIIVSDEEDSSPQTVGWYVDRFADLKVPGSGVGVVVHSVIVTPEGCLGGFGTPGQRYLQTSEALGGQVVSICQPDFGSAFAQVAARTFGLKDRFYPSLEPVVSTLQVRVAGQRCNDWTFNTTSGAVVFDEGSACFPKFDEAIELEYDVYCAVRD